MSAPAIVSGVLDRLKGRFTEIRPIPRPEPMNRRATYGYALVGVAGLVGLAWINNSHNVAAAFLVALVLGLLWVTFMVHRSVLTTAMAIGWWIGTAPALGVIATAGVPITRVYFVISQATATNVGLGVVVWLMAVLTRAPRPAGTVMACWLCNVVVVVAASFVVPGQAWVAGYIVTVCVLAQRVGLLARLRAERIWRVRGPRLGGTVTRDPAAPAAERAAIDESTLVVAAALDGLPPGHAVLAGRWGGALEPEVTMVVGPTGTYAVAGVAVGGPVRAVSGGTRLVAGGRRLDADITRAALAAVRAQQRLRTPVQPVLLIAGNDYPDGLARMIVRPATVDTPVEVLVVRGDLAAARLSHGRAVLTSLQVSRIVRRLHRVPGSTMQAVS